MIWPTAKLGQVATIERRGVGPADIPVGTRYLGLENIERGGRITGWQIVGDTAIASTKFRFDTGHVLFGKLRPNLGKIAIPQFAGVCSTDILPIRPGPKLDRGYLCHFLAQPAMVAFAASRATGANLPRLSPTVLANVELPLPPLEEQRRVAAILDQAAWLSTRRRETLDLIGCLERSCFIDLFGNPVENPQGFPLVPLGHVGRLDRGVSKHRPRNDRTLLGGDYPLIQTGDVANSGGYIREFSSTYSELGLAQSKIWPVGTLCITIAANIAKTGILTFEACFPDSVVGFTADAETTTYVRVWMSFLQKTLEASAPQSAQKNINLAILRSLPVPVPNRHLLTKFGNLIDRLEEHKIVARKALAMTTELTTATQFQAFGFGGEAAMLGVAT